MSVRIGHLCCMTKGPIGHQAFVGGKRSASLVAHMHALSLASPSPPNTCCAASQPKSLPRLRTNRFVDVQFHSCVRSVSHDLYQTLVEHRDCRMRASFDVVP